MLKDAQLGDKDGLLSRVITKFGLELSVGISASSTIDFGVEKGGGGPRKILRGRVVQIDGLLAFGWCEMVWSERAQTEESVGTGHVVLGRVWFG